MAAERALKHNQYGAFPTMLEVFNFMNIKQPVLFKTVGVIKLKLPYIIGIFIGK